MSTTSKSRRDTIKLAEYEKDLKQKGSSKFNDYLLNKTDGVQHFEPVDFGNRGKEHAHNSFLALKQRDKLKDTFCSSNEIAMLRIPYTDSSFEIKEKILSKLANTQK